MTLKELANTLGLSPTTVSRALNGYPEVRDATRQRVIDAARAHNYLPNARARGLAIGRAMAIAHVIPVSERSEMVNPLFADFVAGAGETYARHGYDMLLSVVEDAEEARSYHELAARRAVDGFLLYGLRDGDARVALLRQLGCPFIAHGRASRDDASYSWLDVDNRRAFRKATDFLLDLGHRRIALVNGRESMDFARRRREGFEAAFTARGLTPDARLIFGDEMTERYGFRTTCALLDDAPAPTAFLVSSMISALGVRRAIEGQGLVLGQDISVVTHDDELSYLQNGAEEPIFTATRSSMRAAGRQAAGMLLDIVRNPAGPPRQKLLEAPLAVGRSTGPVPAWA